MGPGRIGTGALCDSRLALRHRMGLSRLRSGLRSWPGGGIGAADRDGGDAGPDGLPGGLPQALPARGHPGPGGRAAREGAGVRHEPASGRRQAHRLRGLARISKKYRK